MCRFVLVFFSPFSIAITSLGKERANLSVFRTFVRFALIWICRFPLPLGVWEGLGLWLWHSLDFSLTFFFSTVPLFFHENAYISDTNEKANLLNNFFAEQSLLDDHSATLPDSVDSGGPTLDSIVFTLTEVKDILNTLKLGKASGPDNVNNRILKEAAVPLPDPLCDLFNYSMSKRVCPNIWKEANVSPLYKKYDPFLLSNYRLVSLLSTIRKVMEKVIHKHMFNF